MSRSGYSDELDPLELGRWRQAVRRSLEGKRGQALLRDLIEALDAMPEKRLFPGNFATADGEFCTLGALGARRGVRMDDLGDADDGCDPHLVGERFGIARAMAAEIMWMNDECAGDEWKYVTKEICGPMRPHYPEYGDHRKSVRVHNDNHPAERWAHMRKWAAENLKDPT